jgi:DNA polymerase-3 subunit chi
MPPILQKVLDSDKKIIVLTGNSEKLKYYDDLLWTHQESSWLPHCLDIEEDIELSPIILTDKKDVAEKKPNQAEFLMLIDDIFPDNTLSSYERIFYIFNGNDEQSTQKARENYKLCLDNNYELHYWQQTKNGSWKEK